MRTALIGAVESSRRALEVLVAVGRPPVAVVTLPMSRSGRHADFVDLRPIASAAGIPVITTSDINAADVGATLESLCPQHLLVIGWSQIFGSSLLALPSHGCLGYHPSALPQNRGRGVIPWTIIQGLTSTAGTLFWLDEGTDSGDVLLQEPFVVDPGETARTLYDKHLAALARMLPRAFELLETGNHPRTPQHHALASYCAKRVPGDGAVDWTQPAQEVWTLIRASGDPYPGAFTWLHERRLVVLDAHLVGTAPYWGFPGQVQAIEPDGVLVQCGDRSHVRLSTVRVEGQPPTSAADVLRLHDRLSSHPAA
jgi:methionyl-tRNA formyltransferase